MHPVFKEALAMTAEAVSAPVWSVERWSDKQGSRGISIFRDGLAVANMVGQMDDSELSIAKQIVKAMNDTS